MNSLRDFNPLFRNLRSMASYSASVRRICIYRLWGSFSAIFILSFLFGVQGVSLLQAVYRNIQLFRNCNAEIPCLLGLSHALCAWLQFEPAALGSFLSPLEELELCDFGYNTPSLIYRQIWKIGKEIRKCSQKVHNWNCWWYNIPNIMPLYSEPDWCSCIIMVK